LSKPIVLKPVTSINDIAPSDWKELLLHLPEAERTNPYVQYEFLKALEDTGSVSRETGWQPCHLAFYRQSGCEKSNYEKDSAEGEPEEGCGALVAVLPSYIKAHSYGEYVFDWAWADAYQRHGLEYYPKILTAVPMTPITGPRFISSLSMKETPALINAAIEWLEQNQMSSWHINFVNETVAKALGNKPLLRRHDIQFHWTNRGYDDFQQFLSSLKAKKRKNIVRERKSFNVTDSEWSFEWLDGNSATVEDWQLFDQMYRNTFDKKGGWAQLSQDFFSSCAQAMPEQTLLLFAKRQGQAVAGAFFMRSDRSLYGRYWGCFEDVEFLHFETCYYQGIEYAIKHGLKYFEPGAQGEHKLPRGFMPVFTHSLHYVSHPQFRNAIEHAIEQEDSWLDIRYQDYLKHSPYKD